MKHIDTTSSVPSEHGIIHQNADICIFEGMSNLHTFIDEPIILDGLAVVLINRGHAAITVEDETHQLQEGCVLVSTPHNFVKGIMLSPDIEVTGLFVSNDFFNKLTQELHLDFTPLAVTRIHTTTPLPASDCTLFAHYLEGMSMLLKRQEIQELRDAGDSNGSEGTSGSNTHLALNILFHSFGIMMSEFMQTSDDGQRTLPVTHNSAESKVSYFLKMLASQHSNFLNVEGYAERLCISPKYFSSICKKVTGKTVGTLINEHIIREATLQLSNTDLSIKEIANTLGFANPSHFGTFIRRNTGQTPQELRNKLFGEK